MKATNPMMNGISMANMPANLELLVGSMMKNGGGGSQKNEKKMTVKEAKSVIEEQEMERLMEGVDIKQLAIASVEESGIVFIDEVIYHAIR
jgi:ATP-dependent HslUV protease ATP-binding subunit HslU